jgi:plastocyanin
MIDNITIRIKIIFLTTIIIFSFSYSFQIHSLTDNFANYDTTNNFNIITNKIANPFNIIFLKAYADEKAIQESNTNGFYFSPASSSNTNDQSSYFTVQIPAGAGKPDNLFEYFEPSSIHIKKGDTISWINKDTVSHTVTAARLNSGLIWPESSTLGKSNYSHTFDHSGVYSYFCQIHPYMSGTVYVDTDETQRQLISTSGDKVNIMIEMPMGTAYENYYNHYFIPANTIVPRGGTVTWINNDYVPHTATAADNSFDTKLIDPFGSTSMVFNEEGRVAYYCKIHPWMQASITVTP